MYDIPKSEDSWLDSSDVYVTRRSVISADPTRYYDSHGYARNKRTMLRQRLYLRNLPLELLRRKRERHNDLIVDKQRRCKYDI